MLQIFFNKVSFGFSKLLPYFNSSFLSLPFCFCKFSGFFLFSLAFSIDCSSFFILTLYSEVALLSFKFWAWNAGNVFLNFQKQVVDFLELSASCNIRCNVEVGIVNF